VKVGPGDLLALPLEPAIPSATIRTPATWRAALHRGWGLPSLSSLLPSVIPA